MWIKSNSGGIINADKLNNIVSISGEVRGYGETDESYCVLFRGSNEECNQYIDTLLPSLNAGMTDVHRIAEATAGIYTVLDSGVITIHDQYDV